MNELKANIINGYRGLVKFMGLIQMADILSIEGRTQNDIAKEVVVECLSQWIDMAKRGEIQDLAMTCICCDGKALICTPRTGNSIQLLGAVTVLQNELIKSVDEE